MKSLAQFLLISFAILLQACSPVPETRYRAEAQISPGAYRDEVEAVFRGLERQWGLEFWAKSPEDMDIVRRLMSEGMPFFYVLFLEGDPLLIATNVSSGETLTVDLSNNRAWSEKELQRFEFQVIEELTAIGLELEQLHVAIE